VRLPRLPYQLPCHNAANAITPQKTSLQIAPASEIPMGLRFLLIMPASSFILILVIMLKSHFPSGAASTLISMI
jgi:hypothetical protein